MNGKEGEALKSKIRRAFFDKLRPPEMLAMEDGEVKLKTVDEVEGDETLSVIGKRLARGFLKKVGQNSVMNTFQAIIDNRESIKN